MTISTTDLESGVFCKGEHKKCMAYEAHTACDPKGYVLGVCVTAGNIHDSVAFDPLFDGLYIDFPQIETVTGDAAYKTPWISKKLIDKGIRLAAPYTSPKGNKNKGFRKNDFKYDKDNDNVICPEGHIMKYSTTNREGYREYKSDPEICKNCPHLKSCTQSKTHQRTITIHIWNEYLEQVEKWRLTEEIKELYKQRKETIERVFADAKEKHGMRYTQYRGLAQVTKWVKLKFACMNLKKFALHLYKGNPFPAINTLIYRGLSQINLHLLCVMEVY